MVQGSNKSIKEIEEQYQRAKEFLERLCTELFEGNKERVIIVPGNHDVAWLTSSESMVKIQSENAGIQRILTEPKNGKRWNWNDLSLYEIKDFELYNRRFLPFAKFYESFYGGKRKYSLNPDEQFDIYEYDNEKLLFVGFNSCFLNDHLNAMGVINPNCISNCFSKINKSKYKGWVKIAVWHHAKSMEYLQRMTSWMST